jgi:hypothetical protein
MIEKKLVSTLGALVLAFVALAHPVQAADAKPAAAKAEAADAPIDLFTAIDDQQVEVKFLAKNDHDARILIKNKTKQPISLKLPTAFAGVPALAQFGGGGGGRGGGGGGRSTGGGGGGGQQQSVGGGGGGGLGGGGGGGGGQFSVPPEEIAKIDVEVVCLEHGKRTPTAAAAYNIVPADEFLADRPAVVELLAAFGRGDLKHGAVQAAAWHLNNDMSWDELAAKLSGTRRSTNRVPYFTPDEIRTGMAYANEATRLAAANADKYAEAKKKRDEKAAKAKTESSETRSTTDESNEPADKGTTDTTDEKS